MDFLESHDDDIMMFMAMMMAGMEMNFELKGC
jgi:hypothetical protein